MVWFQCDDCGDSLKKPKLGGHMRGCSASRFTCIDCSATFDRYTVLNHTQCVTEHEKYALAATKPGGKAHGGAAGGGGSGGGSGGAGTEEGDEFLATRAPWRCSCCNVITTSQETLAGHAGGKKHRNKVKATLARQATAAAPADAATEPPPSSAAASSAEQGDAQKRKREGERGAGTEQEEERPRAIKWKKLIAQQLRNAAESRMSVKKLTKVVLKSVRAKPAAAGLSEEQLTSSLLAQVRGSSKFALLDKHVSLSK